VSRLSSGNSTYPETLEIKPLSRPPQAVVPVPGSKSISNRALILAALSDPGRGSVISGILQSEDTQIMIAALRALGFRVQTDWTTNVVQVRRGGIVSPIPENEADLFVGNSGTSMRFLTALVCLGQGCYRLDGVSRMRERPIADLVEALEQLGVKIFCERDNGSPPVIVQANGLPGGHVQIRGNVSSQFLSGLLMVAPLANSEMTITVDGPLVSKPYVAMTVEMMRAFGAVVETDLKQKFRIPPLPCYQSTSFEIEPDATAASYFWAAAAIARGLVAVPGFHPKLNTGWCLQGDIRFLGLLEDMGARLPTVTNGISVQGEFLNGIDVDMNDISDCVMTLAAVACFAKGETTVRNVAHIRHKETDRLHALATELRKVGAGVTEFPDGLKITPQPLHGAVIETYNDHRIAMSMALIGLVTPGIVIKNPACVAKTYPRFFEDLERLRS
jgi:3-phosphoshikimate 1-carboxyvinyltransferase